MKVLENMWKFTDTDKDISDSLAYKTLEYAENGDVKNFKKNFKELSKQYFGADYLRVGSYRLLGWQFDFKPFLKKFLVRNKYENVYRICYALNKTNIYDNVYVSRNDIIDVIEDNR